MAWAAAIPAAVGAASTLAQSLFGGKDELQAAMMQYKIQKQIADQQYELSTAGQQDARGNITEYIPGRGFVTMPSDATRGLIGASDREERLRLTEDQTRGRYGRERNFARRTGEDALAQTLLRAMQSHSGVVDPDTVTGGLAESGAANINDKANFAKNAIGMQAIRSGMSSGDVTTQIDDKSRNGLRSVLMDARLQGRPEATKQNATTTQTQLGLYNPLASRAANIDDVPFSPNTQNDVLASVLNNQRQTGVAGLGQASAAMARGFDPLSTALGRAKQPNFGAAAGAFGSIIQDLLRDKSGTNSNTGFDREHTGVF